MGNGIPETAEESTKRIGAEVAGDGLETRVPIDVPLSPPFFLGSVFFRFSSGLIETPIRIRGVCTALPQYPHWDFSPVLTICKVGPTPWLESTFDLRDAMES